MRVISGLARGRKLLSPKGITTRPTQDRVREALFNILGPRLSGARFLDLYAGSGANGIEALSWGAASSVFVDNGREAREAITANLRNLGFEQQGRVFGATLPDGLRGLRSDATDGRFDVVFADPPYQYANYVALLQSIASMNSLAEDGQFVLEHASKSQPPSPPNNLVELRSRSYGASTLRFYGRA